MSKPQNLDENATITRNDSQETGPTSRLLQPHLLAGYHSRGYLPHSKVEGGTYWVTFHLADSLPHFAASRYDLHAWVVMPNHVHAMTTPREAWTLSSILHSWKSYTATRANRILGKTGEPFWQREAYDHLVRNDEEFYRICEYTINNPVAAGLCSKPEEWMFSSAFLV